MNFIDRGGDSTYSVIWATANGEIGHAGIAFDNYNSSGSPDGTVSYYDLWPGESVTMLNFDEDVPGVYIDIATYSKKDLFNKDITGEEGRSPDGIIAIVTSMSDEKNIKNKLLESSKDEKGNLKMKQYNGVGWNCSTYIQSGLQSIYGENWGAYEYIELSLGLSSVKILSVTPNALFNKVRDMKNTFVRKNPGNKVNNSFVNGAKQ